MKGHLVFPVQHITAGDGLFSALHLLIDDRGAKQYFAASGLKEQVAIFLQAELVLALEAHEDGGRVGAWRHDEIVLQAPLVAVVDETNLFGRLSDGHFRRNAQWG